MAVFFFSLCILVITTHDEISTSYALRLFIRINRIGIITCSIIMLQTLRSNYKT